MTHPTRTILIPTLAEAVANISNTEFDNMCLSVNQLFGNAQATKLMMLIVAARREVE